MKWQSRDQQPLGWCRSARMTRSTPLADFRELKVQESEPGPFRKASERSTSKQTRSEETSPRYPDRDTDSLFHVKRIRSFTTTGVPGSTLESDHKQDSPWLPPLGLFAACCLLLRSEHLMRNRGVTATPMWLATLPFDSQPPRSSSRAGLPLL